MLFQPQFNAMNVPLTPSLDKLPRATIRERGKSDESAVSREPDEDAKESRKTDDDSDITAKKSSQDVPIATLTKALSDASIVDMWEKTQNSMTQEDKDYYDSLVRGDCSFSPHQETPELIEQSLRNMEKEIATFPEHQKKAYMKGIALNSAYIHDKDHRLKFLRTEIFQAKPAATRFCAWLDLLHELYGDIALTRKLYLSDLSKEDMAAMKSGMIQVLPSRDRIGRRVLSIVIPSDHKHLDAFRQCKVSLYISTWLTDDLTTQQHGVSRVFLPSNNFGLLASSPKDLTLIGRLYRSVPIRCTGFHICIPSAPFLKQLASFFSMVQSTESRNVTRVHTGSELETSYALQTEYGIPAKEIQCTETGRMKVKNLNNWLKYRVKVEERLQMSVPFDGTDCPDFQSIAIRSGGSMFNHPPNKLFRSYLKETEEEWGRATKTIEKQRVISKIVDEIQARGFRYVKWSDSDGCYMMLRGTDDIRTFVATSLRDQIKRTKAKRSILVQGDDKSGDFFLKPQVKKPRIDNGTK